MMVYENVLFAITGVGALGCLAFVVSYWIQSGGMWKRTEAGKFLMVVYANLGALFLLIISNQVFGDWPGRRIVTLVLFLTYVVETWWPLRLLIKHGREARTGDRRGPL